jgi:hypothetical protein
VRKIKKLIQASQQIMKHPKNRPWSKLWWFFLKSTIFRFS